MNKDKLGYFYMMLAAAFFALIAVIGKTAISSGLAVLDLLVLQNALAVLVLFIYFCITGIKQLKINKSMLKRILIQGVIGSAGTTLFYYLALEKVNAGIASMLLFTNPAWVFLYFIITKTRKLNIISNVALLMALFGSALVIDFWGVGAQRMPTIGLAYGLAASFCYAFYNVFADLKLRDEKPLVITFYTSMVIFIVAFILNPDVFFDDVRLSMQSFMYIAELAVISGILPVFFLYKGIALIGADKASIVATSELPITLLFTYFALGEKMSVLQLIGVFSIMLSVIVLQKSPLSS